MSTEQMYLELVAAVDAMADTLVGLDIGDTMQSMTCGEVNTIANVLRVAGREIEADTIIGYHAEGDDEGDEHYQWAPS